VGGPHDRNAAGIDLGGDVRSLGLSLPNRGVLFGATTVQEMYSLAEEAEDSGYFDSVWVGDGLIAKPRLEAIATLSALAARTSRVELGVCCMATFPLRNPVLFACQWASLDVLSDGRSLLAVCLGAPTGRGGGDFAAELQAMGVKPKERVPRMEEAISTVRHLWAGATPHSGEFWEFQEIDLLPKPIQNPCPIWIASNPDHTKLSKERYLKAILRVARLADGWLSTVVGPKDFKRRWAEIREAADAEGRDTAPMRSAVHLMVNIQDDEDSARAEAKRFLKEYYSIDVAPDVMTAWGAYGTPEQIANRIELYREGGLDLPIIRFASFDQKKQMSRALDGLVPALVKG
jgi:alkanesulfonate monooxygenase SsuD/methylene tetrahydromethanopterin reductase-like flavin-dependent oxidoreductase (luciferase family)